jgi:ribonuclease BN (tRNA processing enzyme)
VLDPPGSPKPLYDFHTAPHRIGEVATRVRVRSLVLTHVFVAAGQTDASILSSVRSSFTGGTRFAEDCMRVDLSH